MNRLYQLLTKLRSHLADEAVRESILFPLRLGCQLALLILLLWLLWLLPILVERFQW